MSWKGEPEPTIQILSGKTSWHALGTLDTIDGADGCRVEYLPRIHHIAAHQQSPRIHDQNGRPITIQRTNYLHADVQWHQMENYIQWTGMCLLTPHLCPLIAKDFQQHVGHSSDLDRKQKWFSTFNEGSTWRMGQSRWLDDDQIWRKQTPSFPSHESVVSRNAQKQRWWKIINTTLALMMERLKLFFAQFISFHQLSIYGAVSDLCEEYKTCHVRTVRPVLAGQSDPLFAPANLLIMALRPSIEILAKRIFLSCKSTKNEWKGSHSGTEWSKLVLMQDSWQQLKSDSASWQRTLKNSHNSQNQWHVVITLCQEMKNQQTRRLYSREYQNWARVRCHNQLPTS